MGQLCEDVLCRWSAVAPERQASVPCVLAGSTQCAGAQWRVGVGRAACRLLCPVPLPVVTLHNGHGEKGHTKGEKGNIVSNDVANDVGAISGSNIVANDVGEPDIVKTRP